MNGDDFSLAPPWGNKLKRRKQQQVSLEEVLLLLIFGLHILIVGNSSSQA
jgi:hypothetical protein